MEDTERLHLNLPRIVTVLGLAAGGTGILILFAAGVEFPFTWVLPPGVWILGAMIATVAIVPRRWAAFLGAFGGLFVTTGFFISGSAPNLFGGDGTEVMIGSWIQFLGVVTALVAGIVATRSEDQSSILTRPQHGHDLPDGVSR